MSSVARHWGIFSNSQLLGVQLNNIAVHSAIFEMEHDRYSYDWNATNTTPRASSCEMSLPLCIVLFPCILSGILHRLIQVF